MMYLDSDEPERSRIGGIKLNKDLEQKNDPDFPLFEL